MLNTTICDHAAAEPVVTLDGDTVGAVCPTCDAKLPTRWIGCAHESSIETTPLGSSEETFMCLRCGVLHRDVA